MWKSQGARSLSAVSEAPTSEDLSFRCAVKGRFRYSDLKEAAPWGLWGLYLNEQVLMVGEVDVAVGALWFQLLMAERMVMGRRIEESGAHNHTAFWGMRDTEPVCAPKQERDSRLEMWIHASHRLR